MREERIEIGASQVMSDVLSSGTVSAKSCNTGCQAQILMLWEISLTNHYVKQESFLEETTVFIYFALPQH